MAHDEAQSVIRTLGDVLGFMAPFAGGSVPDAESTEYAEWVLWVQTKQEEYAKRGFWRRCLTLDTIALTEDDETAVLPDRFHKPNGLFMFIVGDVDWNDVPNSDKQTIFIEMINGGGEALLVFSFRHLKIGFDLRIVNGPVLKPTIIESTCYPDGT